MLRDRLLLGVWIGLVAAAATAGVLIGFGAARGTPFQPLNTVAHIALGSRAYYVTDLHPLVTTVGLILHVVSVLVWGVAFALLLARFTGWRLWVGALALTIVIAAIDFVLLPARFSPGFETILARSEMMVVYAVLAASLVLGRKALARP